MLQYNICRTPGTCTSCCPPHNTGSGKEVGLSISVIPHFVPLHNGSLIIMRQHGKTSVLFFMGLHAALRSIACADAAWVGPRW